MALLARWLDGKVAGHASNGARRALTITFTLRAAGAPRASRRRMEHGRWLHAVEGSAAAQPEPPIEDDQADGDRAPSGGVEQEPSRFVSADKAIRSSELAADRPFSCVSQDRDEDAAAGVNEEPGIEERDGHRS